MGDATMTLTSLSGGASVTIHRPLMGYESEIHLTIETGRSRDGGCFFFDNGAANDYRACTMRLHLTVAEKRALNDFLRLDGDSGSRGSPCLLSWEVTDGGSVAGDLSAGFYPFGPDLCCHEGVWVMPVRQEQGGLLWEPYHCFEDKLTLLLLTGDNLPAGRSNAIAANTTDGPDQGPLAIGAADGSVSVGGIMFPQDLFKPETGYAYETAVSKGGRASTIGMAGDRYETGFTFTGNLGKSALLVALLTGGKGRAGEIRLTVPASAFPFGADITTSPGGETVKLLGSSHEEGEIVLKITHDAYNRWSMPLGFWRR